MVHIEQRLRRHDTSGSGPMLARAVGTTVHVYAEQSGYLGRFTVTGATVEGNLIVEGPTGRGVGGRSDDRWGRTMTARQPREHAVPCAVCRRPTFDVDARCERHNR